MSVKDTFTANLKAATKQITEDTVKAARDEASEIVKLAQDIVPVVSGELHDSGQEVDTPDGGGATFTADYAVDVHENPESIGYRFLERAADERAGGMVDRMADAAKVD